MGEVLFPRVVQKMTPPLYIAPVFADNPWDVIIKACQGNRVPESWTVGAQKIMTINGMDYAIDIIGKNHDTYADGSGIAPLTFQLHDCYATEYAVNATMSNIGGWGESVMRNTNLPKILELMPSLIQVGIREVNKLTSAGNTLANIITTADKLFLLSEVEVFGVNTMSKPGEGAQYEFYRAGGNVVKTVSATARDWWMRSPQKDDVRYFCRVGSAGTHSYGLALSVGGVAPAFCF